MTYFFNIPIWKRIRTLGKNESTVYCLDDATGYSSVHYRTIEDMLRRNELVFWFGQQQVGASERKGERREKGIGSGLSFPKPARVFPFTCSESFECLDTPSLVSSSVNSKRRTRVSATEIGPLFSTSCTVTFLVSLLFYSARLGPGPKSAYSFH